MTNTERLTARELYEITVNAMRQSRRQVLDQLQQVREDIRIAGSGRHVRLKVLFNVYFAEAECKAAMRAKAKENK